MDRVKKKLLIRVADSIDALEAYLDGLGTQFSCFDSCLQGLFEHYFSTIFEQEMIADDFPS